MKKKLFKTIGLATLSTLSVGGSALALGYTTQYNHPINKTGNVAESNQAKVLSTSAIHGATNDLSTYGIKINYNPDVDEFELDMSAVTSYVVNVYDAEGQLLNNPMEVSEGYRFEILGIIQGRLDIINTIVIDHLNVELSDFGMWIVYDQLFGYNIVSTNPIYTYEILNADNSPKNSQILENGDKIQIYKYTQDSIGNPSSQPIRQIDYKFTDPIIAPIFDEAGNFVNASSFNYTKTQINMGDNGIVWKYSIAGPIDNDVNDGISYIMPSIYQNFIIIEQIRNIDQLWDKTQQQLESSHSSLHSSWSTWNYHTINNHFNTDVHTASHDETLEGLVFTADVTSVGDFPINHLEFQLNNVQYTITRVDGTIQTGTLPNAHNVLQHDKTDFLNILGSVFTPFRIINPVFGVTNLIINLTAPTMSPNLLTPGNEYVGVQNPGGLLPSSVDELITNTMSFYSTFTPTELDMLVQALNALIQIQGKDQPAYYFLANMNNNDLTHVGSERIERNLQILLGNRYEDKIIGFITYLCTVMPNATFNDIISWVRFDNDESRRNAFSNQFIPYVSADFIKQLETLGDPTKSLNIIQNTDSTVSVQFPNAESGDQVILHRGDSITFEGDAAVRYGANHSGWTIAHASGYESAIDINQETLFLQFVERLDDVMIAHPPISE